MRSLPEGLMESAYGSLTDGQMQFTCWYDGIPVINQLPAGDWSQDFADGSQTSGVTNLLVGDETGELAPWGVDEPLGVGGSLLQTRLVLNSAVVPLGWQRITSSDSNEVWRTAGGIWIPGGAKIDITAEDLTTVVAGDKFVSPESPPTATTCVAEIRRLLLGIMGVTFEDENINLVVPSSITYKDERMSAVEDLIEAMGCKYRVTGTGQLAVYKPNRESVWTVEPGQYMGSLINVSRSQSISGLKNLIVARNTLQNGNELQAAAEERSGPLRTNGPHGRWPEFVQDDFATNQYEIQEAATNSLTSSLRSRTVTLPLRTIFHPGLELGDWITVKCPVTTGYTMPLQGRVASISYGGKRVPTSMDVKLTCDLESVQAVSEALKAQRWRD